MEEKEDEAARKSVAQRFRGDNWKKLVISRYGELSEDLNKKDLVIDVNDIYNEISDPLQNLTLDDGVEVKGQAKRRLGIRYSKIKKKLLSTQPVKMKRLAAVKVKKMEIQQRIKSSIDNEKLRVESLKKLTSLK